MPAAEEVSGHPARHKCLAGRDRGASAPLRKLAARGPSPCGDVERPFGPERDVVVGRAVREGTERTIVFGSPAFQTSIRSLKLSWSQIEWSGPTRNDCGPAFGPWPGGGICQPTWSADALATTSSGARVWPNRCVPRWTTFGCSRIESRRHARRRDSGRATRLAVSEHGVVPKMLSADQAPGNACPIASTTAAARNEAEAHELAPPVVADDRPSRSRFTPAS